MKYYVRPECGREDRWGPKIGPFPEFLQITYKSLRVGPDGDDIAWLEDDGDWRFNPEYRAGNRPTPLPVQTDGMHKVVPGDWHCFGWSDLVIWAEPD